MFTGQRSAYVEEKLRKETLYGVQSLGERADTVMNNMNSIIKSTNAINDATKARVVNTKLIAKCQGIINNSKNTIKSVLAQLGADEKTIANAFECINNEDANGLKRLVLTLLAKRNPGMYARKLAALNQAVAQK